MTGNNIPSTNLPTGLKALYFVRTGTSSTQDGDSPFAPMNNPIIANYRKAIDQLLAKNGWKAASGELHLGSNNLGVVGYSNGIFFVKSDKFKMIRVGVNSDIHIKNMALLENPQGLVTFNTDGFTSWVSKTNNTIPRMIEFNVKMEQQMLAAGGALLGGLISGVGEGIGKVVQNNWAAKMQAQYLQAQQALSDSQQAAISQRNKDMFERNLMLTGYKGASAQAGGSNDFGSVQGGVQGPQPRGTFSEVPFIYGETKNPNETNKPLPNEPEHIYSQVPENLYV